MPASRGAEPASRCAPTRPPLPRSGRPFVGSWTTPRTETAPGTSWRPTPATTASRGQPTCSWRLPGRGCPPPREQPPGGGRAHGRPQPGTDRFASGAGDEGAGELAFDGAGAVPGEVAEGV